MWRPVVGAVIAAVVLGACGGSDDASSDIAIATSAAPGASATSAAPAPAAPDDFMIVSDCVVLPNEPGGPIVWGMIRNLSDSPTGFEILTTVSEGGGVVASGRTATAVVPPATTERFEITLEATSPVSLASTCTFDGVFTFL